MPDLCGPESLLFRTKAGIVGIGSALGVAAIGAIFLREGVGISSAATRAAFPAAAETAIALLFMVALLTRLLPKRLFDDEVGTERPPL